MLDLHHHFVYVYKLYLFKTSSIQEAQTHSLYRYFRYTDARKVGAEL